MRAELHVGAVQWGYEFRHCKQALFPSNEELLHMSEQLICSKQVALLYTNKRLVFASE